MSTLELIPRISEKALSRAADKVYVFFVPLTSNKQQIAEAVAAQYEVEVKDVRTIKVKGKAKTSMQKRKQPLVGKRADRKKAYVTLSKGEIKMLEEVG